MFLLYLKCAEEKFRKCYYSENKRMITGTWATIEINKAIEKGCKIEEIYEICHFERKVINYAKVMRTIFVKLKLEPSPHNYNLNDEYARY